jgi:hypothetical protein
LTVSVANVPAPSAARKPASSDTLPITGAWSARPSLLESEIEERPAADVTFIESGPPLRAFPPPPSLLN